MYIQYVVVVLSLNCVRLCESKDHSPPDSSVDGVLQAGILEWVAISSFRGSSRPDPGIEPGSSAL